MAPDGRAVAYVDPEIFAAVLEWMELEQIDPNTSFDCLVDFFTARFVNDVDMILVVLDLSRAEFLERSRRKVISNFTVVQRQFEGGIGVLPVAVTPPIGPPRLRSYSLLGIRDGLLAGPSLHEIAHSWCAYLAGPPALAAQLQRAPQNHWGFTSVGGVLGGWDPQQLEPLGEGRYRVCGPSLFERFAPQGYANNNIPYAPLELYLMGLLPAAAVPNIRVAVDPQPLEVDGGCAVFSAPALLTVTLDDIVAANGPRSPAVEDSQKDFDVALVILAEQPLTEVRWEYYIEAMGCLESTTPCPTLAGGTGSGGESFLFLPMSFFEATGGRASLRFSTLGEGGSGEQSVDDPEHQGDGPHAADDGDPQHGAGLGDVLHVGGLDGAVYHADAQANGQEQQRALHSGQWDWIQEQDGQFSHGASLAGLAVRSTPGRRRAIVRRPAVPRRGPGRPG